MTENKTVDELENKITKLEQALAVAEKYLYKLFNSHSCNRTEVKRTIDKIKAIKEGK